MRTIVLIDQGKLTANTFPGKPLLTGQAGK